ncbi:MAG: DUF4465 domain-containing protein [Bacteroidales bacterium]|nr:DUF4465 domain-containing protein [Bacteroidales bacterium]
MKKNLFLATVLIALFTNAFNAQTIVDFESLTVPAEGYYNGSTDHSGTVNSTESFSYSDNNATFNITYTLADGYDYWNGFAYSNQTDLTTTDWTNYSAYANPAGGYNNSNNYAFAYLFFNVGDTIIFSENVDINTIYITNSVWAYHYMKGTDGIGTGTYAAGDSLTLVIKGILADNTFTTDSVLFYMADFTNGNSIIIDNWTEVNLNNLGNVRGLKIDLYSSDSWTPAYVCIDNIVYNSPVNISSTKFKNVSVYPNPTKSSVNIDNVLNADISVIDITGKIIYTINNCRKSEKIDVSNLNTGVYFIRIENNNQSFIKKLIIE